MKKTIIFLTLSISMGLSLPALAQVDFSHHDNQDSRSENLETLHNMQGAAAINPYLVNRKNTLEADGIDISNPSNPFTGQGGNSRNNGNDNSGVYDRSNNTANTGSGTKTSDQIQNFFK
jgi:hypothetical protein